jgi:uncharacterized protein YprB with RNaseH-like and TPR domain
MSADLRDRLRRLGVHKGASQLKPRAPRPFEPAPVEAPRAMPAPVAPSERLTTVLEPVQTAFGIAHVRRERYGLAHTHGDRPLGVALELGPERISRLTLRRDESVDLRNALFLDTETTGLAGGAGTLAFLVGLGYFEDEQFVIEQYFLRDPAHEAAMLAAVDKHVNARDALVTFNGRGFDVPLLETRFTLSRIAPAFGEKVHLDLLLPARRIWRHSIGSCSLGSLEYHLLQVRRDQQDIAGFLIPQLYREFLQSGADALSDDMNRVMYHNLLDILSMVTLTARLCDAIFRPRDAREHFAAGAFHERAGEAAAAEQSYKQAAATADTTQSDVTRRLAQLLKRQKRHTEARDQWRRLADRDDEAGLIELAKHYEWRECDITQALAYSLRARAVCNDRLRIADIDKRIARLQRKMAAL